MKTKNFIPTLLALTIRIMVTGQTQETQYRILNVLGGKQPSSPSTTIAKKETLQDKSAAVLKDKTAQPASTAKVYPTLVSTEDATPNQVNNNTYNFYNNPNCYSTRLYATELLTQANELLSIEQSLRQEAKTKTGKEKQQLIESANSLLKQAELKQVQASEIAGKLNVETFNANETIFKSLLTKIKNDVMGDQAISMNDEAIHTMKQAKEMREEAYSLSNITTRLGTLSNAEEKEDMALNEQQAAIQLLKKAIVSNSRACFDDLASR